MSRIGTAPCAGRGLLRVRVPNDRARHHRDRRSRRHPVLFRAAGAVVPPAQHFSRVVAGKLPWRNTLCPQAQHDRHPPRNSRIRAKALSGRRLAIRAGRPGRRRRTAGGTGATPPKRALACASGPFDEVAPGISPCRKAKSARGLREWTSGSRRVDRTIRRATEQRVTKEAGGRCPAIELFQ